MKRDMDLIRDLLFAIEEHSQGECIRNLSLGTHDSRTVAYHCKLMSEAGLVSDYGAQYADNSLWSFAVGSLTWAGHDYLEKIRSDTVWKKTKTVIGEKGLPLALDTIKEVATAIIAATVRGAIEGLR